MTKKIQTLQLELWLTNKKLWVHNDNRYCFRSPTSLLLRVRVRRHLGLHHPHLLLRGSPHLRPRVRGDLLQGETGGGGGGRGDWRGLDQRAATTSSSLHVIIPRCTTPDFGQSIPDNISPGLARFFSYQLGTKTSSWDELCHQSELILNSSIVYGVGILSLKSVWWAAL